MIIHDDPLRCGEELNYAEGLLEHRYQVPAIPMISLIQPDRVTHYFLRHQRYKIWRKERVEHAD